MDLTFIDLSKMLPVNNEPRDIVEKSKRTM